MFFALMVALVFSNQGDCWTGNEGPPSRWSSKDGSPPPQQRRSSPQYSHQLASVPALKILMAGQVYVGEVGSSGNLAKKNYL